MVKWRRFIKACTDNQDSVYRRLYKGARF